MVEYLESSKPEFAVSEYWNSNAQDVQTYLNHRKNMLKAFDFPLMYKLISSVKHQQYSELRCNDGKLAGLVGINRNGSVTFVDNHDTLHKKDGDEGFRQYNEMLAAYALILTHPGVPSVYWEQIFKENEKEKEFEVNMDIIELMLIRKNFKIKSDSNVNIVAT